MSLELSIILHPFNDSKRKYSPNVSDIWWSRNFQISLKMYLIFGEIIMIKTGINWMWYLVKLYCSKHDKITTDHLHRCYHIFIYICNITSTFGYHTVLIFTNRNDEYVRCRIWPIHALRSQPIILLKIT